MLTLMPTATVVPPNMSLILGTVLFFALLALILLLVLWMGKASSRRRLSRRS